MSPIVDKNCYTSGCFSSSKCSWRKKRLYLFHADSHLQPGVKKPFSESCFCLFSSGPVLSIGQCPTSNQKASLICCRPKNAWYLWWVFLLISSNFHKTSSVTGLLCLIMDSGSHQAWSLPTFPGPHSHSNAATNFKDSLKGLSFIFTNQTPMIP